MANRSSQLGVAIIEWLVATPVCMLVGLGALQWALVFQARHGLDYAVEQGARYAAVQYGRGEAINEGLAKGLQPFWLSSLPSLAQTRVKSALAAGWMSWDRVAPGPNALADFGQPARSGSGQLLSGDTEIPNDNLRFRSEAKGAKSKISVQDANRLLIELTYGIPLKVPVVGGFIVRIMEIVDGCETPEDLVFSTAHLGKPEAGERRQWTCRVYRAPDIAGGRPVWRLPVRVRAERWMQSPLRKSSAINSRVADSGATAIPVIAPVQRNRDNDVLRGPPPARPSPPEQSPQPNPPSSPIAPPPGACPKPL